MDLNFSAVFTGDTVQKLSGFYIFLSVPVASEAFSYDKKNPYILSYHVLSHRLPGISALCSSAKSAYNTTVQLRTTEVSVSEG